MRLNTKGDESAMNGCLKDGILFCAKKDESIQICLSQSKKILL